MVTVIIVSAKLQLYSKRHQPYVKERMRRKMTTRKPIQLVVELLCSFVTLLNRSQVVRTSQPREAWVRGENCALSVAQFSLGKIFYRPSSVYTY